MHAGWITSVRRRRERVVDVVRRDMEMRGEPFVIVHVCRQLIFERLRCELETQSQRSRPFFRDHCQL